MLAVFISRLNGRALGDGVKSGQENKKITNEISEISVVSAG